MKKKILVLAAHPDDEVIGCGATIAKLSSQNHDIQVITFTDGKSARGVYNEKKDIQFLDKISEILGIKSFKIGDFPDNKMDNVPLLDVIKYIEKEVIDTPDIIFTHHPDCLNIDHSIIYRATITAFRPIKKRELEINCFEIPSSTEWNPLNNFKANLYVDVEGFEDKKIEAMKVYDDEIREYPHPRSYEGLLNKMKFVGNEVSMKFAEKFQTVRKIIL